MIESSIYIVNVTTIKFHKSDNYPDYSPERLFYHVHSDRISSIHISLQAAEEQNERVINACSGKGYEIFAITIDEYDDGAVITSEIPNTRWVYDASGNLIDVLNHEQNSLKSSSVLNPYSAGDIVEILTPDQTLNLAVILDVPSDNETNPDKFTLLTGPYYDDVMYCDISRLRNFKGSNEDVSFMKMYYSNYPHNALPHYE